LRSGWSCWTWGYYVDLEDGMKTNVEKMIAEGNEVWNSLFRGGANPLSSQTLWEFGITRASFVEDWVRNVYGERI
jgi:hypothetical protein